jgi:hypothetical protein
LHLPLQAAWMACWCAWDFGCSRRGTCHCIVQHAQARRGQQVSAAPRLVRASWRVTGRLVPLGTFHGRLGLMRAGGTVMQLVHVACSAA